MSPRHRRCARKLISIHNSRAGESRGAKTQIVPIGGALEQAGSAQEEQAHRFGREVTKTKS